MISIAAGPDGQPVEDEDLRQALDACLEADGQQSTETVAKTIFPQGMWRRAKGDRAKLYKAVVATQKPDGSWADVSFGPEYATPVALVLLQLDNDFLTAFSR